VESQGRRAYIGIESVTVGPGQGGVLPQGGVGGGALAKPEARATGTTHNASLPAETTEPDGGIEDW